MSNVQTATLNTTLFAPILETEKSEVQAQAEWLRKYLAKTCPNHPADVIRAPDRLGAEL
jgi:hypothetical protein